MAARLHPRHQAEVREKIRGSQLINALQKHVLSGAAMKPTQVQAALGLLKKIVPDLSNTAITGANDGPVQVNITNEDASA